MEKSNKQSIICHLTSAHSDGDIRIFHKLACSSAERYKTYFIVPNGNNRIENNVEVIGFHSEVKSRIQRMKETVDQVLEEALKVKADIYHLHDPELLRIAKKLKSINGAKVVFDSHEDVPKQILDKYWIPVIFRKIISRLYGYHEKRACKNIDGIVSVTPIICERFSKFHPNVEMIANYPEIKLHESQATEKRHNHICYIGGLYETRGLREVILAIEHCDVVLHLAGSFDTEHFEMELKQLKGWKKVVFYGHISQSEVTKLLGKCSIGVVTLHPTPSYLEAYPIKMFEYMNAGLALLSSDFPLYRSLLDKIDCSEFVNPLDPNEISKTLTKMLETNELLEQMGKRAKNAAIERFNWSKEKEKLYAFYDNLLHA
jgi:glycosyltransferase involved in cell wall biosynthesis